jgi:uncharacterized repeat protein (TIGR01451 family)
MKKNPASEFGLFNPRVLLAFALCSIGVLLGMLSFAGMPRSPSPSVPAAPGFHTQVTAPGSGGGSESYVGIGFVGPRTGNRVLAWQAGAKYNISPDGVNWNFTTAQIPGTSGGGDVASQVDAFGSYYIMEFCTTTQGELQACLHKSTNGGTSWTTTTIANVSPNPIDRPWVEVYPKLGPTATITSTTQTRVYLEYHTFTDGQTYLNTSTDGGATFGPPTPAAVGTNSAIPDSNCNTVPSGITIDQRNGTAYAVWLSGDDVAQDVATGCNITQIGPFNKAWVTKSTNDGLTWMIPSTGPAWTGFYDVTTNTGDNANKIFGSASVDYAGQVHVLLTVRKKDQPLQYVTDCQTGSCVEAKADTDLVFVTSPDAGVHWTAPRDINLVHDTDNNPDTNKHTYFYPWSYAGAKGMVDAMYYFSTTNRPNDVNDVWFAKFSQITDAVANPPGVGGCPPDNLTMNGPACYVGTGPQVAAETLLNGQSIHNGQICTFGLFCDLVTGGDRSLLDSNNIAIDPAGGANGDWTANANPSSERVEFACQNSGRSVFDGINAPEPFAGGSAILNGCYGPTDMSVTKTDSPDPVARGGTLTYHMTVTNNGMPTMPATTSGVTLTDVLPPGVTFVSATPSSGTCSGTSTVVCKLGIFPSGATATVDIVVTAPNTSGTLTNTATVAAATTDPTLANNTATAMTTVGTAPVPTVVVSRKIHGTAGTFDIALLPPAPGIECRTGGATGDHTVVVTFALPVTVSGNGTVKAQVTSGTGQVGSGGVANGNAVTVSGAAVTVPLTNVANAQRLTITIFGVSDGTNAGDVNVPMAVLLGDTTANGSVNSSDISQTKAQSGTVPTASTFRTDVTVNGLINSSDISTVKSKSGTALP